MMSRRGEIELVEATLAGDRGAFDELVALHERSVYSIALRVTGNREDALDAAQTAFLKAYDNLRRFDRSRRFFSWIYRIGLNEALNIVKRRKRFSPLEHDVKEPHASPEERARGREAGRHLEEALAGLSPEYRTVVVLRHVQGLSYQEMSEVIGVPAKTVKSRLFTARRELRRELRSRGVV